MRSSFVRASKVATRSNLGFVQAARPLSTSARLFKREIISEKQIPISSYTDESAKAQRTTIPVRPDPEIEVPAEAEMQSQPISRAAYENLPKSMQQMTVMDKVIIVSGYAYTIFLPPFQAFFEHC